jgi:hypothetical protein
MVNALSCVAHRLAAARYVAEKTLELIVLPAPEWDLFISHASEDKPFVRPLVEALQAEGLRVWYDEFALRVGVSLRRSIDAALARAEQGVVIISPAFLRKEWPQKELDALVARESSGKHLILPVWHNVTAEQVAAYSPTLADRFATSSMRGLDAVIRDILSALNRESLSAKMSQEHGDKAGGETIDHELLLLADEYLGISVSDWSERVRLKDAMSRKMAKMVIDRNISKDLLAVQGHEGLLMALASAIHASPDRRDFARISRIPHKVERLHVKYRIAMALARIFEQHLALRDDADRALEILDLFNVDADPVLRHRIYKTRRVIKLALEEPELTA